jgi:hypothetical protein
MTIYGIRPTVEGFKVPDKLVNTSLRRTALLVACARSTKWVALQQAETLAIEMFPQIKFNAPRDLLNEVLKLEKEGYIEVARYKYRDGTLDLDSPLGLHWRE